MSGRLELKQRIVDLDKQIEESKNELYSLMDEFKEKYEVEDNKALYLNKYYKYKDNCYSCPNNPEDYWDIYYRVVDVTSEGIQCIIVEKDSDGTIKIGREIRYDCAMTHLIEITKEEYCEQFDKLINEINDIRNKS